MLAALKRHLRLAIHGPHPRALDRHPPATQRHLPVLAAVPHREALRVVLAPRADQRADPPSSSPPNTPTPTSTDSTSSPSYAAPTSSPNTSRTRSGSTPSSLAAYATDTVPITAVPPLDLGRTAPHAPTTNARDGATAVTSKLHEHRDNL